MSSTLFPVFLKTEKKHFLVIGGRSVAIEKVDTLLKQAGEFQITILAPSIDFALQAKAMRNQNIQTIFKRYHADFLENVHFVVVATNQPGLSAQVKKEANAKNILVNAADQPDFCDFYLGSIVNKGDLKIAISTNGKSPIMARRLKEYFNEVIPDEIQEVIDNLHEIRNNYQGSFHEKLRRLNEITSSLLHSEENRPPLTS